MVNRKIIIGWLVFFTTLAITCFWAYWGINENFYEGWYHTSIGQNLLLAFIQYLSIPIIFLALSLIAINYPKIGAGLFIGLGLVALFFFNSNSGRLMIFIPMIMLALGFYYSEFRYKKVFIVLLISVPLIIILSFGLLQLIKVGNRFNDEDFGSRVVSGNEVQLTWAPQGAGFPLAGTDWLTAVNSCARLNEEGTGLADQQVNIWRLPTREEIVRSMARNNSNAGGFIDDSGTARYQTEPDKETPLWNPHSPIIYYWTSDERNDKQAFLVAYNGVILSRNKTPVANYQGYRCVK